MYPTNNASPERIAVGAVVQISDGAVQTSGVSIKVKPQGAAASAGGGTTTYEEGIVGYVPTQAETNYTSFQVIAYKTGCIPVAVTVVTTASAVAGHAGLDWGVMTQKTATNALTNTTVATVTTLTGHTPQTGDSFALANGANGFAAIKAQTAAIETDTAEIGAAGAGLTNINLPNQTMDIVGNITGNLSGSVGSVTGAVGSVTGNVGGNVTGSVGSVTGLTAANLDATVSSRASAADLATVAGYLDTEIAAIKAVTDLIPNAGALTTIQADLDNIQTRIPAALTAGGNMKSDVLAFNGDTTAAANIAKTTRAIARITASGTPTTTSIDTSSIAPAVTVADQLKGRILTFDADTTTAALRGQATDITANSAGGVLTVTALTTAPVSGDTGSVT